MPHGPEHELEHSLEHADHNDPFDRQVSVTMAIVAAILATLTMFGHRSHNETLLLQGEANRFQTESNIFHTKASDQWGFFQAKNIRLHQVEAYLGLADALGAKADAKVLGDWKAASAKYKEELPKMQAEGEALVRKAEELAKAGEEKIAASEEAHHRAARLDLGELAVEIALVLCSVAVLSKRRLYWQIGLASTLIGLGLAVTAYFTH
jgi:hypothetical protein